MATRTETVDDASAVDPQMPRKSRAIKIVPFVIVAIVIAFAFYAASRPTPGQRTSTDTSVSVIVSVAEPKATTAFPIQLQEGGDPKHESSHVFAPIEELPGVARATLDWSSELIVRVEYDPELTAQQEIASALSEAGYLRAPTQ